MTEPGKAQAPGGDQDWEALVSLPALTACEVLPPPPPPQDNSSPQGPLSFRLPVRDDTSQAQASTPAANEPLG